jgi:hypothetical protein
MNEINEPLAQELPIADGEWIMIHCDTFISDRDRVLLKEHAFMIDRDLAVIAREVPATFSNL